MKENTNGENRYEQRVHENIDGVFSLTPLQKGMLFHKLMEKNSGMYFEQAVICFKNKLNVRAASQAMNLITVRHDALRACFIYDKLDEPKQVILKKRYPEIVTANVSGEKNKESAFQKICEEDKKRGFILDKDPLVRTTWVRYDENEVRLILSFHHIIMDGWCLSIIMNDFSRFYYALCRGKSYDTLYRETEAERADAGKYGDYLKYLEMQDEKAAMQHWTELLADCEDVSDIQPLLPAEPAAVSSNTLAVQFNSAENAQINAFCKHCGITVNTLVETALGLLLQKLNRTATSVFGRIVSGRDADLQDISDIVGLFINCIPVKVQTSEDMTAGQLVQSVLNQDTESLKYEYCSLADIQSNSPLGQDLVKVILAFENYYVHETLPSDETDDSELDAGLTVGQEEVNYDISFLAYVADVLTVKVSYHTDKFCEADAQRILALLRYIIRELAADPERKIEAIPLLPEDEKDLILNRFNDTATDSPQNRTIAELFEEQVEKTPDHTAVVFENTEVTYAELNAKANSLAHRLRETGVKPDDFVAIIADRSIEMIAGIYGIVKSGAAYVPIDPTYPEERIRFMLDDCKPKLILKYTTACIKLPDSIPVIDLADPEIRSGASGNLPVVIQPENAVYCIYTSGTTGTPKGVVIPHQGAANLGMYLRTCLHITEHDRAMMFANYIFDGSVWEILTAHMNGAALYIPTDETIRDIAVMERYVTENRITVSYFPPAYFDQLHAELSNYVITAGSQTSFRTVEKVNRSCNYINSYGPTEASVCTTCWILNKGDAIPAILPIGKPISNMKVYIANGNQLCGIGVPGELCIAGAGLASGYLNRPELTAEKFVQNPFGEGRMYRSGDLARWLPDGNIEYLGRIDEQVKIRGFRIELGEIESKIREIKGIKDCTVIARADAGGDKALYAYYTGSTEIAPAEIRERLSESLPYYMVPARLMQMDAIPVTRNGKVDKRALPEIESGSGTGYAPPETETQRIICDVLADVLHLSRVGLNDRFLMLGGDSIKAIQVISGLRTHNISVSVNDIMKAASIAQLAARAKQCSLSYSQEALSGFIKGTPIQNIFLHKLRIAAPDHFNQSTVMQIRELNTDALHSALTALTRHHDILRVKVTDNRLYISAPDTAPLYDFTELDAAGQDEAWITEACSRIQRSMRLAEGHLIKAALIHTAGAHYLALFIHHIAVDAVSWHIITEDLQTAYLQALRGEEIVLQEKTASVQDWAEALEEYRDSVVIPQEKAYWKNVIAQTKECRFRDTGNPAGTGFASFEYDFGSRHTDALMNQVNDKFNTETSDILLACTAIAVSELTGEKKTALLLEGYGRQELQRHTDLSRSVGWFTAMYPAVLSVSEDIGDSVVSVKDTLHSIPNKGIGFGLIMDEDGFELTGVPVSFNYLGEMIAEPKQNTELQTVLLDVGDDSDPENYLFCRFGINMYFAEKKLKAGISYDAALYSREFAESFCKVMDSVLERVIRFLTGQQEHVQTVSDIKRSSDVSADEMCAISDAIGDLFG